jgi:hypothetical protein
MEDGIVPRMPVITTAIDTYRLRFELLFNGLLLLCSQLSLSPLLFRQLLPQLDLGDLLLVRVGLILSANIFRATLVEAPESIGTLTIHTFYPLGPLRTNISMTLVLWRVPSGVW